jgi:signal transduction histidine kinase
VPVLAGVFAATLSYDLLNYPGGPIWIALIIAFGNAIVTGHRIAAYASLVAGYAASEWGPGVVRGSFPSASSALGLAAWMLVLLAVSEVIRNRRAYLRASRAQAIQAERAREEQARREASEQRLDMARELHDVLAHAISLINVQAGVALELIDRRPEQARTALAAIKQASKQALVEVQEVLGELRRPGEQEPRAPARGLGDLGELVSGARAAGLAVRTELHGAAVPVPAGVGMAAFRIVQEALTNVARHAGRASVVIQVTYGENALTVQVDDNGPGPAWAPMPGGGNGISGMRKRAAALGGELQAGQRADGGFRVRAQLPLSGAGTAAQR